MKKVIITGASKGLGEALAQEFLANHYYVEGWSRTQTIQHEKYAHKFIDLSSMESLKEIHFNLKSEWEELILINNAGRLGKVSYVGDLEVEDISQSYVLNAIAPAVLCNEFIRQTKTVSSNKYILNISSGAAKKAIDGWSIYSSSKASLNAFSTSLSKELSLRKRSDMKIKSLSPGVIDTEMQEEIRGLKANDFSLVENFQEYYTSGQLQSPLELARKIFLNFKILFEKEEIIIDLKDII